MDDGEDLLVHLGSSGSLLFEYTELEDWYEARKRKKEPTVSLKTLVEGLMKDGKISKRKITNGNESYDVYWLCYSNEKKEVRKVAEDIPTRQSQLKRRLSHSKFVPPRSAKKLKTTPKKDEAQLDCPPVVASKSSSCPTSSIDKDTLIKLTIEKKQLLEQVHEKESRLQKLRLVKLYRTKNDLSQLEGLISKWRSVSQEAAQALLELSPTTRPRPSMGDLLNYLSISSDIIQYDHEDESFY